MPRKKKSETVPREMYEEMRAMYDALLTKYDALKLAGASKPEAERLPLAPPKPNLAVQMAHAKAGSNRRLLDHYLGFITQEEARGTSMQDIATMIEVGMPDDVETMGVGD